MNIDQLTMSETARMYAKIMAHLENETGCSSWDFRTLNLSRPKTSGVLWALLGNVLAAEMVSDVVMLNHYVPSRIWSLANHNH